MSKTKILYYIVIILSFFLSAKSYSQIKNSIEEDQYSIDYVVDGYDYQKDLLVSSLRIHMKDKSKIFVKSKVNGEFQTRVALENKHNINSFEVEWPTPTESINDGFYYTGDVSVPINIDLLDQNSNTEFDLHLLVSVCDKTCFQKLYKFHYDAPAVSNSSVIQLLKMMIVAFIGGVVLNFMPCVLPVLSIKILSIINTRQQTTQKIRRHFLATVFGIITSFLVFASIAYLLKISGEYAGLGLNFQQPQFITFLVLSLIFFACSLEDKIVINLPGFIGGFLNKHSDQSKLLGSFLTGAFSTVIATSCTAPFVGSAISFSLLYGKAEIYYIFFCLGLGMSLPYIILATKPNLISGLPKPGKWMLLLKKLLAALVYLTVLWLMFIISNLLDMKAAVILFMLSLLFKFVLENKQWVFKYVLVKIVFCILVITASFLLPKITYKDDEIRQEEVLSIWKKFNLKELNHYIADDKIILVDVTADWCVTCKYNKFMVLDNEYMLSYYAKHNIVVMRANYTLASKEINDFLESYSQRGIPFDVVYSKKYPRGIVLPTVLKTSDVLGAFNKAKSK
jgi:suppressor for copper-sensitivity B